MEFWANHINHLSLPVGKKNTTTILGALSTRLCVKNHSRKDPVLSAKTHHSHGKRCKKINKSPKAHGKALGGIASLRPRLRSTRRASWASCVLCCKKHDQMQPGPAVSYPFWLPPPSY